MTGIDSLAEHMWRSIHDKYHVISIVCKPAGRWRYVVRDNQDKYYALSILKVSNTYQHVAVPLFRDAE